MARARKSPETSKEKAKPDGLSSLPYSSRVGGDQYVIYVRYQPEGDEYPRILVLSFLGTFAAKWFCNKLIGDDSWEFQPWKFRPEDTEIITSRGISIRAFEDQVKQIMAYEFVEDEANWKDDSMAQSVLRLKHGKAERDSEDIDEPEVEDEEDGKPKKKKHKQVNATKREAKPPKEVKVKVDKTGMLTAGDLAARLKIEPSEFRAALRKLKMQKPAGGWLFNPQEADDIVSKVKKALK